MTKYMVQITTDDLATALRLLQSDESQIDESVLFEAVNPTLPNMVTAIATYRPRGALHFVGFKDERYYNAVKVFGQPDFIHRVWDQRAKVEVAPDDQVVFASEVVYKNNAFSHVKYHPDQPPSEFGWDDSAQPDDPATHERT